MAIPGEPSGLMDGKAHQSANSEDYTINCDLVDEEIHFSRDPISRSFDLLNSSNNKTVKDNVNSANNPSQRQQSFDSIGYQTLSPYHNSTESGWQSLDSNHLNNNNGAFTDQAKSYRLLHNIGSKLRRGSNYLVAPKLVGQYLLGITIQSWAEFFNTSRLMKAPANKQHLTRRVLDNLSYFQGNYLCVSLVLVVYCILTSPLLLLALATYAVSMYLITVRSALGKQTCVLGYRFNLQQQYSFITMLSLPLLWVAGAQTALFWVIGASFFVVGLHALLYANESHQIAYANGNQQTDSSVLPPMTYLYSTNNALHPANNVTGPYRNLAVTNNLEQCHLSTDKPTGINSDRTTKGISYYNHQRQSITHCYLPLEQPPSSTSRGTSASNYLYQWIPFAGRGSNYSSSINNGQFDDASGEARKPEVKIISQDYAGLGRVYEV